jgi:4-diphosphocytidyl-2-C-methyl-D-erythritol kinase
LHFERRGDGQISREDLPQADSLAGPGGSMTLPPNDLTVRAAQALRAAAGHKAASLGVHIGLIKRIPSQAGLGGGSSDAASTLLALNRLWQLNLPLSQLLGIGLKLGADVPFFLHGSNAWVEGIGEIVTPVELPAQRFVVAKPPAGLETAQIFSHPALQRNTSTAIILGFAANPFEFGRNDLQTVAQELCPGVGQGLSWLAQHGLQGRMTGSGSAVFAPMPDIAPEGVRQLDETSLISSKPAGFVVRVCSNLAVHPLKGWSGF